MGLEYWLKGDIPPGPIKATVITDISRVAEIIKKNIGQIAIFIGSAIKDVEDTVGDVVSRIAELSIAINAPIITSDSNIVKKLTDIGFKNYIILFPLEMVRKISRGELKQYRLLIFIGHRYAYQWLLLNHIKHYRPDIQTLSLDPYPQPNATWTLPPLPLNIWYKNFVQLIELVKASTAKA
jgi:CO dehydrogenase/acetyl-CoA synthase epsilon subunit